MATAKDVLKQLAALAGENEATLGSNNTTVNKYFNAPGQPYCGYSIWYACKKAGSNMLNGCTNPAYVPTLKTFLKGKYTIVKNENAQAGDIFAYSDQHVGFVYAPYSGSTVITLEGNSTVYKTEAEARTSAANSGKYEGIGFKKRTLTSAYTVYRPVYDADTAYGTIISVYVNQLSTGNHGPQVKAVQRILYARGITGADNKTIEVDGVYGANTKAAVVKLQKILFPSESSQWDGTVGAKTWGAMLKELL